MKLPWPGLIGAGLYCTLLTWLLCGVRAAPTADQSLRNPDTGAFNEGVQDAYPSITFPELGLCTIHDCYQKTSDPGIKFKSTTGASAAPKKRRHMNVLPLVLNSTLVPTSGQASNNTVQARDLASLPPKQLKPGHAICYTQGRHEHNYQITIAKAYDKQACRTLDSILKKAIDHKDLFGTVCTDGKAYGLDYFTTDAGIHSDSMTELLLSGLNEVRVEIVNKAVQEAFPDVVFGDDGTCTVWGCYDPTSHDRINVKNMACTKDTSLARATKRDREHERAAAAMERIKQGPAGKTNAELQQELVDAGYTFPKSASRGGGKCKGEKHCHMWRPLNSGKVDYAACRALLDGGTG